MEIYQFGKYWIQLDGSWRKPDSWRIYQKQFADHGALTVHEQDMQSLKNMTGDGWKWKDQRAAFLLDGKPLFSVQVTGANETAVQGGLLGILYSLLLTRIQDCIGLHGVTIRCGGKTVILSAPSGTGKTTLSNLLLQYRNAEVINGDFALLSLDQDKRVIFEPTPFCGSSGICQNLRLPVDQIVFLRQGKENVAEALNTRQACANLLTNTFVPGWDGKLTNQVMMNVCTILEHLSFCVYSFKPDESAAAYFCENIL